MKVLAVLVRQANIVRERNGSVLGENRLRRQSGSTTGSASMARARMAVNLYAAGFEETRKQVRRVFGGFLDGNREPAKRRVERHRAANVNQARAGIARHGQFFLAAARAGEHRILDGVEIGRRARVIPGRIAFARARRANPA